MFISASVFVLYLRCDFQKTLGCKNVSISTQYKQKVGDNIKYFITLTRPHFSTSPQLDSLRSSTHPWFLPFSLFSCLQMPMARCAYHWRHPSSPLVFSGYLYTCLTKKWWLTWKGLPHLPVFHQYFVSRNFLITILFYTYSAVIANILCSFYNDWFNVKAFENSTFFKKASDFWDVANTSRILSS